MKLLLIALIAFFSFAKGNLATAKSAIDDSTKIESHSDSEKLELNNGKKWKIVKPMFKFLEAINHEVKKFDNSKKKNYNALAKSLSTNIDSLLSNCSMKGKAHDELHKWLIPFMELVEEYESNERNQLEKFVEIKNALAEFNNYFESE